MLESPWNMEMEHGDFTFFFLPMDDFEYLEVPIPG